MKTLLVLTDFSQAATHAAKYAALFAKQLNTERILLFNKLQSITTIPSTPLVLTKTLTAKEEALSNLKQLANELKFLKATNTELMYTAKEGSLDDLTNELIGKYQVDFVVMGLTGKSKLEQTLIGSNTLQVAKTVSKPLLIVPELSKLTPISKIATVLDLLDLKQANIVSNVLKSLLNERDIELHVMSQEHDNIPLDSLHNHNFHAVKEKFSPYKPSYYTISGIDFVFEVLNFTKEHRISLLVHIEKKRNFFENLFMADVTEKMAYISHIPLLLVKQPN